MNRDRTLRRHTKATAAAHAAFGAATLVLSLTGVLLVADAPHGLITALGGHDGLAAWHRRLGLGVAAALLAAPLLAPHRIAGLTADVLRLRRSDIGWALAFTRFVMHPSSRRPPYHDGRFDPAQRVIFAIMGVLLAGLIVSGIALITAPRGAVGLVAISVRVHELVSWAFLGALGTHIVAGSGLLPSHRGVTRAMIDGRVQAVTASRLWPEWASRQQAAPGRAAGTDATSAPSDAD